MLNKVVDHLYFFFFFVGDVCVNLKKKNKKNYCREDSMCKNE